MTDVKNLRYALIVGVVAAAIAILGLFTVGATQFFRSYLFAFLFWLGISLGSLTMAMLHYLVGGRWGILIRQTSEAAAKSIWVNALLFIPIVIGMRYLYPWTDAQVVAASEVLQHKSVYLNVPFFIMRAAVFFVIWIVLARLTTRWALQAKYYQDPHQRRNFQRLSAFGLILYVLSMTFASVDWIMSLQPEWYSTIYGLLIVGAQALTGLSFSIALLPWRVKRSPLKEVATPDLYRDLGALLLTTVMVWAYFSFSQYLIMWAGNLPHEITWYLARGRGGWIWLGIAVMVIQFVLPFLVLLSLRAKRNLRALTGLAFAILFSRLLDHFWQVTPAFYPQGLTVHWLDVVMPFALGGFWVAAFLWHLSRTPALIEADVEKEELLESKTQPAS
jgi:uncharacterized membrane protein